MYKCNNFGINELVHPQLIRDIGEYNCWLRLDRECLISLDLIRDNWGDTIYINWRSNDSRGLRPPNDPDGARYSVHKQGKAFDLVPGNGNVAGLWDMAYELIENNLITGFNTLESIAHTPSWVHIARMNTQEKPLIVNP